MNFYNITIQNKKNALYSLFFLLLFLSGNIFAGNVFNRHQVEKPTPLALSYQSNENDEDIDLEAAIEENVDSAHSQNIIIRAGKRTESALRNTVKFYHNNSDVILRCIVFVLDGTYLLGNLFEDKIPSEVTYGSYTALNFAVIIGFPFMLRETKKALGDTKFALKHRNKEITTVGSIRSFNNLLSTGTTPAYLLASLMLLDDRTRESGENVYDYLRPVSIIALLINPSLDLYHYFSNKRILKKLDTQESTNELNNNIISLWQNRPGEISSSKSIWLAVFMRARIDPPTWNKIIKLLKNDSVNYNEVLSVIKSNIELHKKYAVGDLGMRLTGDVLTSVEQFAGPGKAQSILQFSHAVLFDAIFLLKKRIEAKQRNKIDMIKQSPKTLDDNRFAFNLATDENIPFNLRMAAITGCNYNDSYYIVQNKEYKPTLRLLAAVNCSHDLIIQKLDISDELTEPLKNILDFSTHTAFEQLLQSIDSGISQESDKDTEEIIDQQNKQEEFKYLTQKQLFDIASDEREAPSKRYYASTLLHDSEYSPFAVL